MRYGSRGPLPHRSWTRLLLLAALPALLAAPVMAGESADEPPVVRPDENTIYIPYKDLEKVFEKSGRGVFLPYEKFLELWSKSRPPVLEGSEEPPLSAAITAASFEGKVREKIAAFKASFQVEVFRKGWTQVPFAFGNLGLSKVSSKQEGAVLTPGDKGDYSLLVRSPGIYQIEVEFAVRVDEKDGERFFRFQTPAASLARFSVELPGRNLDVDLKPNLAASETPADPDGTRVFAFLGPSKEVEVRWRARAERVGKLEPILHPTVLSRVRIEQEVLDVEATVVFKILQAPADRFRLRFPSDLLVISREGANLQRADITETPEGKVMDIRLHSGVEDRYEFRLRLQKTFPKLPPEVAIPFVTALDVQREEGAVAVDLLPPLKGKVVQHAGLSQADVRDLPESLRVEGLDFGFTYQKQGAALTLEVEKEKPEVTTEVRGMVFPTDGRVEWRGTLTVTVERTGIFGLKWLVPTGPSETPYEIQKLYLRRPGDLNYTVREAAPGSSWVEVTFPAKTQGTVRLHFELRRERPGELPGTLELPWFRVPSAKKDRGWVGVATKEGYDLRLLGKAKGFEARNVAEVQAQTGEAGQLGFVYNLAAVEDTAKPEFDARIEVVKRPSRVSAKVFTLVDVTDSAVTVEHTVRYDIQQAGVRKFSYSLPSWVQPEAPAGEPAAGAPPAESGWKILEAEVEEKKQQSDALDEERQRRVWTVEVQKERMGAVDLKVQYKLALKDLKPGAPRQVPVPDLQVEDVFQATGYVGLKKGDNIVLDALPGAAGKLFKADLGELESPLAEAKPFSAFRYTEYPWGLSLGITKYDYEKALPTVVNHLHVESVVTEEREIRTRVLVLLQNKDRQSLRVKLPEGAKITFFSVDGKAEQVSRVAEGEERIKLLNLSSVRGRETPFLVKLHYDVAPATKGMRPLGGITVPALEILGDADESAAPPVARLTLDLHLPPDPRYISFASTTLTRLTRSRGIWERIRDFFLGTGGTEVQAAEMDNAVQRLRMLADDAKAPGEPPFSTPENKKRYRFYKLSGGGAVAVTYMGPVLFQTLNVLVLIAAVGIMIFLPYYEMAGRTQLLLLFLVGALLVSALSEALTPFMGTVFLGTLCSAVFWVGFYILREIPPMMRPKTPPPAAEPPAPAGPRPETDDPPETPAPEPTEDTGKTSSRRTKAGSGRSKGAGSGKSSRKSAAKGTSGRSTRKGRGE